MKYSITLEKTGDFYTWDQWVAKPKEERTRLIVQYGPGKVEVEKENDRS